MKNLKLAFHKSSKAVVSAIIGISLILTLLIAFTPLRAQPPNCITATQDPNKSLCDDGCYTWALVNNCDSCIDSIIISDSGITITNGCAVVLNPTHEQWQTTDNIDGSVSLTPAPGDGPWCQTYPMQITLCGISKGDKVTICWNDSPDGPEYCESITVP